MKKLKSIPLTLLLIFLLTGTALAAATYDFLIAENSTFDTTIGDWTGQVSWTASPSNNASGAARVTSVSEEIFPGFYNFNGYMASACYNIDYSNWPGTEKSITFSGYVKNESMPSIKPLILFHGSADCSGSRTKEGSAITSSDWTSFSFTVDMASLGYGWNPASVRVYLYGAPDAADQVFYADDLRLYSSTPTSINLQSFAAHTAKTRVLAGSWSLLAALALGAVVVVVRRKRKLAE